MTLSELCRLPGRALWWGLAIAAIVALLLIWGALTYGARMKDKAVQAGAAGTFATARARSAGDAIATQDAALNATAADQTLSKESSDVIHQAPGADVRLNPDLNRTGRGRMCLRATYRNSPECVQHPGGADAAR